jgi:transcriptional regulator with XRE-family HTH domain
MTTHVPPLRAVREAQGYSLREVARRANVDAAQLSRVERGLESLSVDALARVADVLGLRELNRLLSQYTREVAE